LTVSADEAAFRSGRGSSDHLLALQRLATSNIVFSVTRRCPARCSHCIVSSGPEISGLKLAPELVDGIVAELPTLKEHGVEHMTFTGGEPVLAATAVAAIADAAAEVGISASIVTSCAWARTSGAAEKVVAKLAKLSHWDLGYDRFHAAEYPIERVANAVAALRDAGRSFSIRACVDTPASAEDEDILAAIEEIADGAPVFRQGVKSIGRAAGLEDPPANGMPMAPCLSTGPFVREDGSVGPCCSGLAYEKRGSHPFEFGNVGVDGLGACRDRWQQNPLLRLIRLVGFSVPLGWLAEEGLAPAELDSRGVCELCVGLWDENAEVGRFLAVRAAEPGVIAQLDRLEQHLMAR
jgi:pyruvate-formate lyase-activating enzyme